MELFVYPRMGTTDRLRIWVGVNPCREPPDLTWRLDGTPLNGQEIRQLRALQPVRPDWLASHAGEPRAYSGLFEIAGGSVSADSIHRVEVGALGRWANCVARSLPARIPQEGFHILLCSCFHLAEANGGGIGATVEAIRSRCRRGSISGRRPDLAFLMGDQVYLDLPTFKNFPKNRKRLAAIFEQKYLANWRGGKNFHRVLDAAPSISLPDDHEFWNNFPHRSPIIQNSWTARGRRHWRQSATALFGGFQEPLRDQPGDPMTFDVPPVSFFLADTRSQRRQNTFMTPRGLQFLRDWATRVNDQRRIGVFVSGQSMYAEESRPLEGAAMDWELPNYDDFREVRDALMSVRAQLLLLTGDVHWGRVVHSSRPSNSGLRHATEIIVSPAALVTSVGKDQVRRGANWLKSLFGHDKPWPRHSDAKTTFGPFGNGFRHVIGAKVKGDQLGLLSFVWRNDGRLMARVRYWNVNRDSRPAKDIGFALQPLPP